MIIARRKQDLFFFELDKYNSVCYDIRQLDPSFDCTIYVIVVCLPAQRPVKRFDGGTNFCSLQNLRVGNSWFQLPKGSRDRFATWIISTVQSPFLDLVSFQTLAKKWGSLSPQKGKSTLLAARVKTQ